MRSIHTLIRYGMGAGLLFLVFAACSDKVGEREFQLTRGSDTVTLAYDPGPPSHVFDSTIVSVAIRPARDPGQDSLIFELLPAQGGWARALDSFLVRDTAGWYRARVWLRPTQPGQFVLRWQTVPFTGFTYYLSAWYDSLGEITAWDEVPDHLSSADPLLVSDTMELVFGYWPHVWYRRVHFVAHPEIARTFWVITESLQRGAGVSSRICRSTANLTLSKQFPLRTRIWDKAGWVTDTLQIRIRDTLVAWLSWHYEEFVENWEKSNLLFRSWEHESPEVYFQTDRDGHLLHVWKSEPQGKYIAAKMVSDTSRPDFDSLKKYFISHPSR